MTMAPDDGTPSQAGLHLTTGAGRPTTTAAPGQARRPSRTVYIREEAITAVVEQAFTEFLFHPQLRALLTGDMNDAEQRVRQKRAERRERLQRRTADLARRQHNVLSTSRGRRPERPIHPGAAAALQRLHAERQLVLDEITVLDAQDAAQPRQGRRSRPGHSGRGAAPSRSISTEPSTNCSNACSSSPNPASRSTIKHRKHCHDHIARDELAMLPPPLLLCNSLTSPKRDVRRG
jgi:hypothetical protein